VNSMFRVRERMDWSEAEFDPQHHIHGTHGGRASEYHSISKLMQTPQDKERYLHLALDDAQKALSEISGDLSGYLAIRGHIYRELGRLQEALDDFEEVRRLREALGDDGSAGEALADLGLIHLMLRNRREALRLLKDGVQLLENSGSFTFAIRARKRLALAQLKMGRPHKALKELCTAYDMAQERHVYGQITPLMETIHELACRLGLWRRRRS